MTTSRHTHFCPDRSGFSEENHQVLDYKQYPVFRRETPLGTPIPLPCVREVAPAVFVGVQHGFDEVPDLALYNLTADIEGHIEGSTVSADTLIKRGYALPVHEHPAALPTIDNCPPALVYREVVKHPRGGYTHALPVDATQSTVRVYRGWWPTRNAADHALESLFS